MYLNIASLNSGSNGNCYYVGNYRGAVLIDAGISCRETEKRLTRCGLSFRKIKAIFISHEHTDHTRGVEVIARRYRIPVYLSEATFRENRLKLDESLVRPFNPYAPVMIGDLAVNAFPKNHDAVEPHSFTVASGGITIGIFTDIGAVCDHVIRNFRLCHAAFLEANYDEIMLDEGRYPPYLKKRIKSDHGHLSNLQALELFTAHKPAFMTHLLLSHLSHENNNPELVMELFRKHAGDTTLTIASRYEESAVYRICGNDTISEPVKAIPQAVFPEQMKLF